MCESHAQEKAQRNVCDIPGEACQKNSSMIETSHGFSSIRNTAYSGNLTEGNIFDWEVSQAPVVYKNS